MPAHFENDEKCDGAKFELVFTRYRQNLKTVGNLTAINPLQARQEFDVNEMYLHLENWSA